ncbi:Guanine nucleotide exchange factor DBS [Toxocara canis]|uniref:Guanine nucleotide exchange factor DBS n=1 Tax=Toxocara canis TaxID=6265 RepID=A0A0B2UZR3_TOXCA|nr:Guanine nucleotide exchange factor DBS [Toxocara canis]
MKSSAAVIAQSLSEFGRCLKETELPNDVETTARILEIQTAERDAIKEDFRISIRKGLSLLRHVRQLDVKPEHEQLSPTRLHNVTAIERMLIQLEETERSFDTFWARHEKRLTQCLQLRRFEDSFRKGIHFPIADENFNHFTENFPY